MKKILIQFCLFTSLGLLFIQCDSSSDVNPITKSSSTAANALVRLRPILSSVSSGNISLSLPAQFCHPSNGSLSIDWKLYAAPVGSTGMGQLIQKKTTEGISCAQAITFEYQNTQPMKLVSLITIYDGNSNTLLAYGTSNSIVVE